MTSFNEWLTTVAIARNSLLCVGLDPRAATVDEARRECVRIIDATAEFAAAFKPNSAFFEVFGADGIAALRDVIAHVPDGIPVILDAKRGDIGDTSEMYARAAFETLGAHAVTVSPYLGGDSVAPFLARPERGAFVLCKTSNPGADEFQSLPVGVGLAPTLSAASGQPQGGQPQGLPLPLYEIIAARARAWNANDNVGLVVGATYPDAVARVRAIAPDLWFLVPGIGTQGGDLPATLAAGLRADGMGLLINASRSIARASDPRAEAMRLRDEINRLRQIPNWHPEHVEGRKSQLATDDTPYAIRHLAHDLIASDCVRFGDFTLKSGMVSPIYIDLRRLVSYPAIMKRVARLYAETMRGLTFDRIAGIPYAGLPIATAVGLEIERPVIYPRSETKTYGTRASVEGVYQSGEIAIALDDLVTTGGAKIEAIQKLESVGLIVRDVIVLIERGHAARATLGAAGYQLHAVVTLDQLLDEWKRSDAITQAQYNEVQSFLAVTR